MAIILVLHFLVVLLPIRLLIFEIDLRSRRPCQQCRRNYEFRRGHIFNDRREHHWTARSWEYRVCRNFYFFSNLADWLTDLMVALITVNLRITRPGMQLNLLRHCDRRNNDTTSRNYTIDFITVGLSLQFVYNNYVLPWSVGLFTSNGRENELSTL